MAIVPAPELARLGEADGAGGGAAAGVDVAGAGGGTTTTLVMVDVGAEYGGGDPGRVVTKVDVTGGTVELVHTEVTMVLELYVVEVPVPLEGIVAVE